MWLAILKVLKMVPLWVWLALAAIAAIYFYGEYKEAQGESNIQTAWDAQKALDKATADKDKMFRDVTTTVVQTVTVEKLKTITLKGDTRVVYRDKFVPTDSGTLSGGFRLFHDASATNAIPDPARIPTAIPVAVEDVADTLQHNYTQCHKAYALVEGWNEWADKQCAQNPKGCPNE